MLPSWCLLPYHTSHLISCVWYLQAEPPPEITWLKDDEPISPWIQVINTEGMSQLYIPSSKRSDSAIYTIKAKNPMGEALFDVEVRVTGKKHWNLCFWHSGFIRRLLTALGWLETICRPFRPMWPWLEGVTLACLANQKEYIYVLTSTCETYL